MDSLTMLQKHLDERFDNIECKISAMNDKLDLATQMGYRNTNELTKHDERFARMHDIATINTKEHDILFESIRKMNEERISSLEKQYAKLQGGITLLKFIIGTICIPIIGIVWAIISKLI